MTACCHPIAWACRVPRIESGWTRDPRRGSDPGEGAKPRDRGRTGSCLARNGNGRLVYAPRRSAFDRRTSASPGLPTLPGARRERSSIRAGETPSDPASRLAMSRLRSSAPGQARERDGKTRQNVSGGGRVLRGRLTLKSRAARGFEFFGGFTGSRWGPALALFVIEQPRVEGDSTSRRRDISRLSSSNSRQPRCRKNQYYVDQPI